MGEEVGQLFLQDREPSSEREGHDDELSLLSPAATRVVLFAFTLKLYETNWTGGREGGVQPLCTLLA